MSKVLPGDSHCRLTLSFSFPLSLPSPHVHPSSLKSLLKKILPIPGTLHFICYKESKTPGYCCSNFKENFFLITATKDTLYHSKTAALLLPNIYGWTSQQWLLIGITWGSSSSSTAFLHQCPIGKAETAHCNSAALRLALLSHLGSKLAQLLPETPTWNFPFKYGHSQDKQK